jgi:HPt (histidine-containing phosphotransfer) domain-containing protein
MPDDDYGKFLPVIDVKDGLKRVMNKKKLFWSLLGRFKMREMVETLQSAVNQGDFDSIKEASHAIKGAAGNLGCISLRDITAVIEAKAKEKQNCADNMEEVMSVLEKTEKAVQELLAMPVEP